MQHDSYKGQVHIHIQVVSLYIFIVEMYHTSRVEGPTGFPCLLEAFFRCTNFSVPQSEPLPRVFLLFFPSGTTAAVHIVTTKFS